VASLYVEVFNELFSLLRTQARCPIESPGDPGDVIEFNRGARGEFVCVNAVRPKVWIGRAFKLVPNARSCWC
jgi:hypothetical protein